jgi:hypothetical protein
VEVVIGPGRKSWKVGSGSARKLKKGQLGEALSTLGRDGWELAGTVSGWDEDGTAWLCFKRPYFDEAAPSLIIDPTQIGAVPPGAAPAAPVPPD